MLQKGNFCFWCFFLQSPPLGKIEGNKVHPSDVKPEKDKKKIAAVSLLIILGGIIVSLLIILGGIISALMSDSDGQTQSKGTISKSGAL